MKLCAFLPIATSFWPKQMSGPGEPPVTNAMAFDTNPLTPASTVGPSVSVRQFPRPCALPKLLSKEAVAFWRQAGSTSVPVWSAFA